MDCWGAGCPISKGFGGGLWAFPAGSRVECWQLKQFFCTLRSPAAYAAMLLSVNSCRSPSLSQQGGLRQPHPLPTDQKLHRQILLLLQPFNGLFSRTTWVSRYQKGKTNLHFTGARDREWQWHQMGHMQVCTLLQTDNHASTPPLFFTGRMPFLPPNQQRQSTEGT